MSTGNGQPLDDSLEAYLDGLLDAPAKAVFERRLTADASLRAELERQRVVDASLRRLFAVPDGARAAEVLSVARERCAAERESGMAGRERGPEAGEPAGPREAPAVPHLRDDASEDTAGEMPLTLPSPRVRGEGFVRRRRLVFYSSAAVVLLALGAWAGRTWLFPPHSLPPERTYVFKPMAPETAIAKIERDNYEPDTICRNEQQFAAYAWANTGQGLAVRYPLPENVRIVGWSKFPVLSEKTAILIAQVGERYEFVIMDRVANDRSITGFGAWKARRETVGGILLYQLTTEGEPALKDAFYDPKRDEKWYRDGMVW